jgi:proteasome lid subunit RPN8/RPN11
VSEANEVCYVLTGRRKGVTWRGRLWQRRVGGTSSVEFDWAWVLEREDRKGDVIGFYHTHPAGLTKPSQRDVRTMRAWVSCLGKPLLCVIESGDELAAFLFETDESDGVSMAKVQRFPRSVVAKGDKHANR